MTPSLIIAGKNLSIIGWLDFDQRLEPIGGNSVRRMATGSAFKLSHWRKYRVSLSASGWVPAALNAINYDAPFEIELPWPESFAIGEALPPGWSSRAAPWDEKTVTDQAGNSVRLVWPKLTVIAEPPVKSNGSSNTPSWELVCEEI